jgi:glycosyltransferase involved in cell wall biosynthesis
MTIALCVMVKNEAATLPRLLRSVEGFVNRIIALDTGSTDGTVQLLRERGADVLESTFKNFGESRTELMQFAKGKADWLLLLDADQTLRLDPAHTALGSDWEFIKRKLDPDKLAYSLLHAGDLAYWVPRLIRGNRDWSFVGATHEYLDTCSSCHTHLRGVFVDHHADGGARSDKSTRDLRLLTEEMEREPDNARTVFYLANTYRDLGNLQKARELFIKRVSMGGWDEEIFVSRLEAAKISLDPLEFWEAWSTRRTRAEPLYWLERLYRARGEDVYAFFAEDLRRTIKFPEQDILFVERPAYVDAALDPLPPWKTIPGWWYDTEEEFYKRLISLIPIGGEFIEVGTWLGRSFACFNYWAKKFEKHIRQTAVDTFKGTATEPNEVMMASGFPDGVRKEFIANMTRCGIDDFHVLPVDSLSAARLVSDYSVNAIFLDGDHSTAAVLADIRAWLPKVVPGGYLCGHDFDRQSVRDAVLSWFPGAQVKTHGRCWITRVNEDQTTH